MLSEINKNMQINIKKHNKNIDNVGVMDYYLNQIGDRVMMKNERRFLREVKTHCKFSEIGYITIWDKRRFPLIDKMLGKELIGSVSYSETHRSVRTIKN